MREKIFGKNVYKQVNMSESKQENKQLKEVVLGVRSTGEPLAMSLASPSHMAVQGMTRSGKSSAAYSLLSQLATSANVLVDVVDPTTVLAAPLAHGGLAGRVWLGRSPADAIGVVADLVEEMDERVQQLWDSRRDKWTSWTPERPLRVLVVEELPGLVERLDDDDKAEGRKAGERLQPRFIAGIRQLLAQGLKVGVVVILLAQRFDAGIISGAARSNIGIRVCLRVDDGDAVRMLFPGAEGELIDQLATVQPGRGVATSPFMRAEPVAMKWLTYEEYLKRVGVT